MKGGGVTMKVILQFEDKQGNYSPADDIELEYDSTQLLALFNADEIIFPKQFGPNSMSVKYTKVLKKTLDLYKDKEDPTLEVRLKER
jgi:hypothetical protein